MENINLCSSVVVSTRMQTQHTHTHIRQRRIQRTSTQCPNVTNILENVTHPTEQMTFKTECFSFVWKNATDSHSNWCAD